MTPETAYCKLDIIAKVIGKWINARATLFHLTCPIRQTCYTSRRIRLFASSGSDFQEGVPDLAVRRIQLALRQLNAEADA
jgi:hypothetical protein